MANNGRGENEQKNNFSGSLKALPVQEIRHCEQSEAISEKSPDFSGSLSEQRFPNNAQIMPDGVAVGKHAHPIKDTVIASEIATRGNLSATKNEPNVSDNLKQENQPAVGWASQPTNNAAGVDNENVSGSLKDNNTNEQGVAVACVAHPTAEEPNISGSLKNTSVILTQSVSEGEESLSNNKDFSPVVPNDGNLSGSLKENAPLDLPELNTQNWHIIVQKLTPELGANVLLAQHSSLVKVEDNQITLSVHKSGELFCKPAHLSALGEVLSHHYGTQKTIQLIEWQDNFENASQAKQRHKEEEQQQRLIELQQDPFAQKLQQVFGGEWTVK